MAETFFSRKVSNSLFVMIECGPLSKVSMTYCPPALYDEIAVETVGVDFFFCDRMFEAKII